LQKGYDKIKNILDRDANEFYDKPNN